ncbi:MAG: hypothetical protein DMD38_08440 [Gemmatimonadetes bacterium]|nr:MAG: hypothetical protein AUG85_14970 [Gemmatimonadetes bacterium 13_1_20CM_4_66_11]PYP96623.1 MAG: hypothetical protein DMD38_08440 [Gemmatimonadota bacterium]
MLLTLCILLHCGVPDSIVVYSGRERQLDVRIPRFDAEVVIDGELADSAWRHAALLTGFSQYAPNDGVSAADSTQVLVWYSATAIYFGIRAFELHGRPTATLANRDQIFGDDNVQILLGTFHDGKKALMFAVNPLGVQGDGAIIEGANITASGYIGGGLIGREQPDLSPDYVFQSRGRVTDWGYEVEVRIPFKSLGFQPKQPQDWSLNILRQVKHSGFEDTWFPARRANATFIGQSGNLVGLAGMHRGLVMDINPEATGRATGAPGASRYSYDTGNPQVGGNVRWGLSDNLNLNGTIKPDFSQVESDAGQLAFDPRQALFFPEKRPFFLEASELFQVPQNLIYTRRIVQPVAAVKLTGNASGTDVGFMSAVDGKFASASGADNPIFNILRLQHSLGHGSRLGLAYTDQIEGGDYNRVAEFDSRLVFKDIYGLNLQFAGSRTRSGGVTTTAPLWLTQLTIQHRVWGLRSSFAGISDNFQSASGFIGRNGIVHSYLDPSHTTYGKPGAFLQRLTGDIVVDGIWQYQNFIHGRHMQDKKLHFNVNSTLRGGWNVGAGYFVESFGYDSALFANYRLEVRRSGGGLDTIPFVGQPTIPNGEWIVQIGTPQWKHFSGNGFYLQGHDENFFEWASAWLQLMSLDLSYRPTERLRNSFSYFWQQVNRRTDGSLMNVGRVARAKLEYQLSRPLFIRLVGQYIQDQTDSLRDDSRTNAPILIAGPSGVTRTTATATNLFHVDALISYQPVPGTVVFAGYGSDMLDEDAFRFRGLTRTGDAFFVKLSYLFRL